MIIAHAILGLAGWAVLLGVVGLIVVAVVLAAIGNTRRHAESEAVPLWWDQASVPASHVARAAPDL